MLLLLLAPFAFAGDPDPVSWDALSTLTAEVWTAGPGAPAGLQADGLESAARRPVRGPTSAWAEIQHGVPSQEQLTVAVDVPLRLGLAESRASRDHASAVRAEASADRMDWTELVQEAWLDGWADRENALHLGEYAEELATWIAPLESAAEAGLVARLDVAELQVERARVLAEQAASEESAAAADARLSALLGRSVSVDPADEALHGLALPEVSPWLQILDHVSLHPSIAAAKAEARAARSDLRALQADALPLLSIGGMTVQTNGNTTPLLYAGVSVPLRTERAAQQARARAAASAWTAEAQWQHAQVQARVEAEQARWEAARRRMEALDERLLAPLEARQEATLAAFQQGLIPASHLVLARRDLHEAEHEKILVLVSLLASQARARALDAAIPALEGDR